MPSSTVGNRKGKAFAVQIREEADRKERARNQRGSLWFGLGSLGLVGWSVVAPTVAGAFFGVWLDRVAPGGHPWTLTFLIAGLVIGCWSAWLWVAKEGRSMDEKNKHG
jgi:ATP synthase protein I